MPLPHSSIRSAAAISVVALLALAAGCSKSSETSSATNAPVATTRTTAASQAKTSSPLGDLSGFRRLATDVAAFVDKGDLPAATARIKDLEIAWDSAEAGLKPRAAGEWHVLDKAIDHALKALRADAPTQISAKAALSDLLKTFDLFQATP